MEMLLVECPYCNWCMVQPSPAEYETDEAYEQAMKEFEYQQKNHPCNQ
jgi:hypothetical protein